MSARPKSATTRHGNKPRRMSFSRERKDTLETLLEQETDDLEFHMTFPSPSLSQDTLMPFQNDIEPVVFILGWEGCSDEELAVYTDLYEERGCITVRYIAPLQFLACNRDRTRAVATRLVGLIPEMSLTDSPVIVHALGDSGCGVYQFLREELQAAGLGPALTAAVFDSGPNKPSFNMCVRSVLANRDYAFPYRMLLLLMTLCEIGLNIVASSLGAWAENFLAKWILPTSWQFIKNESFPPALFIYSEKGGGAELAGQSRSEREGQVILARFDNSVELLHYEQHQEMYTNQVVDFLRDCLDCRYRNERGQED